MKKFLVLFLLVALVLVAASATQTQLAAASAPGYVVVFKDSVANADTKTSALEHAHGFASDFRYAHALKGFAAHLSNSQLQKIKTDPDVAFVTPDHSLHSAGMVTVVAGDGVQPGLRRIEAATTTSVHQASNVNVAIIDTGISLTHPDLNAVNGVNCIHKNKTANDDYGHGTHVAGILAAKNNGAGVVGVAPGTKLYAVKVLDSTGNGSLSQVICGVDWVTQNANALNIRVANMSLIDNGSNDNNCGNTNADALHKAICNSVAAGVTYVVAAGNNVANYASNIPAVYPEVLTVTSMADSDGLPGGLGPGFTCRNDIDDQRSQFSNYAVAASEMNHTIAAPGTCIYSTWLNGGYYTASGTSMSAPYVAGTVALCLGNGGTAGPCNGLAPAQIVQKIIADSQAHATSTNGFVGDPFHPMTGQYFGYLVWAGGY